MVKFINYTCIHIHMSTKTISITDEAYGILKAKKEEEAESFSEVIVRLAGRKKLASFAGILSEESAGKLEEDIKEIRRVHQNLHQQRLKRMRDT